MNTRLLLVCAALFAATGCTHSVHQVATGGLEKVPTGKARIVEAEADQTVILYITGNTDYADEAYEKLLAECPHGELTGIEARSSTSHGFLSFTNKLHARAYCVE